jgi:ATP-dependent Clp protease ATP-binding subunit ClpC
VSKQAAQQRFAARPWAGFTGWSRPVQLMGRRPSGRGFLSRFTPPARQVITGADGESRALGHPWVGTEHLLLSMLRDPGSPVSRALASFGIDVDAVARGVVEAVGEGEAGAEVERPFTDRAKRVLELALEEALESEAKQVEPEHILLAVLREGEGVAAAVLVDLGVSLDRVREAVRDAG